MASLAFVAVMSQLPVPLKAVTDPATVTTHAVDAPALNVTAPLPLPPRLPSATAPPPKDTLLEPVMLSADCAACAITSVADALDAA